MPRGPQTPTDAAAIALENSRCRALGLIELVREQGSISDARATELSQFVETSGSRRIEVCLEDLPSVAGQEAERWQQHRSAPAWSAAVLPMQHHLHRREREAYGGTELDLRSGLAIVRCVRDVERLMSSARRRCDFPYRLRCAAAESSRATLEGVQDRISRMRNLLGLDDVTMTTVDVSANRVVVGFEGDPTAQLPLLARVFGATILVVPYERLAVGW